MLTNNRYLKDLIKVNSYDSLGCRPRFTFFLSNDYTNYHNLQTPVFMGHEIALHTVDNIFKEDRPVREWAQQILAGRLYAQRLLANLPDENISGFRAPFLKYNEKLYTALRRTETMYDSSFQPKEGRYSYADTGAYVA